MPSRRQLLSLCAGIAIGLAIPLPTAAQDPTETARTLIQSLGEQAIRILDQPGVTREQLIAGFRDLLERGFDVPYIGRFVLGRYWNQATPEQRETYLDLFRRLIVETYADRFAPYADEDLDPEEMLHIVGTQPAGARDIIVATRIMRPDGPPVQVDWRVRVQNGTAKVIDVAVEGISMGLTQRQEFAAVIQRGGGRIEALLEALRTSLERR